MASSPAMSDERRPGGVVGVLTTSFPRWAGDPAGSFVADRVAEIARAGERVVVLAAGGPDGGRGAALPPGVEVVRIPFSMGDGEGPGLFYGGGAPEAFERRAPSAWGEALLFASALAREAALRAPGWTRIESHWLVPCAVLGAACAPRVPHRAHAHSGDVWLLERLPLGGSVARQLLRSGADLIFVTRALQQRFARLAGREVGRVEPMRPDPSIFHAASAAERAASRRALGISAPLVLAVGRLVPIKGFDLLVRAVAELSHGTVRPVVAVVGDGPEREPLRTLAARLRVDLRLPGTLPRRDVAVWMRAAEIYVQPSRALRTGRTERTEGMPVAALEAAVTGLPVVAADTGGLAELQDHVPGTEVRLFPAGSSRLLAARLARYVNGA